MLVSRGPQEEWCSLTLLSSVEPPLPVPKPPCLKVLGPSGFVGFVLGETAMSSLEAGSYFPTQRLNLSSLDEKQESCFKEAKTAKMGTKFIIRDTAQHVGEHTEKRFVYLRQKQGRNTHSEKRVCVPSEKPAREVISIPYMGQFFLVFALLWPVSPLLFPHLSCL